jgi:fatty-acyl-CoA synthase
VSRTDIPLPGQAPLPAAHAAALLRTNATDAASADAPAILFDEERITHRQYYEESIRWARLMLERTPTRRALHVGVLLDNTPDYLFALGGAALSGSVVVGCNHTRRGEHLLRDLEHTDVDVVVTELRHWPLLEPIAGRLPEVLMSRRDATPEDPDVDAGEPLDSALAAAAGDDPGLEPDVDSTWLLIFTSGVSAAPKAVICSQRRMLVTGTRMGMIMDLGPSDVGYVCMPLFHSNALMVGWAPAFVLGAAVGLARRFSASRWLDDVRRYRATYFNYTGKPLGYLLATEQQPDDADNPLRIAFGNEGSPAVVGTFSERFGVEVIDAYGATEGGIGVSRVPGGRPGALGWAPANVRVVDEAGHERAPARFDVDGRLLNAEDCVGEIVNTEGAGPFEGYYRNDQATARTTRWGWYWSGDLGYLDEEHFLYFAGRDSDWLRVDGENFPAQPIETAITRHPDVVLAAIYGVPDASAGDQVMAAIVLRDNVAFEGEMFAAWIDAQGDLGPKWRPRYVRVLSEVPTTGTNKVIKRMLVHEKFRLDRVGVDEIYVRDRGDPSYRTFGLDDEAVLRDEFERNGRRTFWDL